MLMMALANVQIRTATSGLAVVAVADRQGAKKCKRVKVGPQCRLGKLRCGNMNARLGKLAGD